MSNVKANEKLEEKPLNEIPPFYESLVDNPVADIVNANISTYNFIRLDKVIKQMVTVPAGVNIPPVLGGKTTATISHNLKQTPFPFIYKPLLATLVGASGVSADEENIYVDLVNYNLTDQQVELKIFVYKFIQKK